MAEADDGPPPERNGQHEGNREHEGRESTASTSSPPPLTSDKAETSLGRDFIEINMQDVAEDGTVAQDKVQDSDESSQAADGHPKVLEEAAPTERPGGLSVEVPERKNDSAQHTNDRELPPLPMPEDESGEPQRQDVSSAAVPTHARARSDTVSTTGTQATSRSTPVSSTVFVVNALETIAASREARKSKELDEATSRATNNMKQAEQQGIDPEIIFRPLQLATKTSSIPLQVTALDCIGKLITYSYFAFPSAYSGTTNDGQAARPPLIERAIETICDCFENEATPIEIQQQIVKSLLAAVLNDKIVVHGAGLLKAVRQIYNIFIYSRSSQNQQVAQGSLTQMVGTVFERVRVRLDLKEARLRDSSLNKSDEELFRDRSSLEHRAENGEADEMVEAQSANTLDVPAPKEGQEKMTLQSFENTKNIDDAVVTDNAPTTVTRAKPAHKPNRSTSGNLEERGDGVASSEDEEDDIYIRDAFLVFRSLCKLSQKVLTHDQQQDVKSQNMRSKLLSLHLIHHLMNNHMMVFISPLSTIKSSNSGEDTAFMQVAKPHLCLSLSRNAASSVPRVFEVCCEMFGLALKHMRVQLKVSQCTCTGDNDSL